MRSVVYIQKKKKKKKKKDRPKKNKKQNKTKLIVNALALKNLWIRIDLSGYMLSINV